MLLQGFKMAGVNTRTGMVSWAQQPRVLTFLFLVMALGSGSLVGQVQGADVTQMVVLQDALKLLVGKRDSLHSQQAVLQASADSLANEVAELKRTHSGGTASGELAQALRRSLALTLALEVIFHEEVIVGQEVKGVRLSLRDVYGEEIDRLVGLLPEHHDSAAVAQIQTLQTMRRSLDEAVAQKALPTVTIGADDTPDDIRLKAELMTDVALQIGREKTAAARQLTRLVEEQRLRERFTSFTSDFGLFDDTSPQGRSVSAQAVEASATEPIETSSGLGFDVVGIVGPPLAEDTKTDLIVPNRDLAPAVDIGREVVLDGLKASDGSPVDELGVEIQKLRLHQQALVQQEKLVQDRVERLQQYLTQLLEGQAP
ncbi:MAG: hypothetical protein ACI8V2_000023 [Candidatus Latescibacterota bacterium]|jgi:hypothetical protein